MPGVRELRNNCAELRGIARLEDEEDADAADDARHHGEERLGLQQSFPLREEVEAEEGGHLDARHEGEPGLQAVEPDEGEVAAHHRQRQVLHEHGEQSENCAQLRRNCAAAELRRAPARAWRAEACR